MNFFMMVIVYDAGTSFNSLINSYIITANWTSMPLIWRQTHQQA